MSRRPLRMHQTTVRFTSDLWSRLEQEAERTGVSAAQYVRDATLARMERAAVASPNVVAPAPAEAVTPAAAEAVTPPAADAVTPTAPDAVATARADDAAVGDEAALAVPAGADALFAQAQLARARARSLRVPARAAAARRPQGWTDAPR